MHGLQSLKTRNNSYSYRRYYLLLLRWIENNNWSDTQWGVGLEKNNKVIFLHKTKLLSSIAVAVACRLTIHGVPLCLYTFKYLFVILRQSFFKGNSKTHNAKSDSCQILKLYSMRVDIFQEKRNQKQNTLQIWVVKINKIDFLP